MTSIFSSYNQDLDFRVLVPILPQDPYIPYQLPNWHMPTYLDEVWYDSYRNNTVLYNTSALYPFEQNVNIAFPLSRRLV